MKRSSLALHGLDWTQWIKSTITWPAWVQSTICTLAWFDPVRHKCVHYMSMYTCLIEPSCVIEPSIVQLDLVVHDWSQSCILVFTTLWKTWLNLVERDWVQSGKTILLHPSCEMWLEKPYQVTKYDSKIYIFELQNHNTKFLLLFYHINTKKLNFYNDIETYLNFKSSWWSCRKMSTIWSNSSSKTCYIVESCSPQASWTIGNPNGQGMRSAGGKMIDDDFFSYFFRFGIFYFF